MFYSEDRRVSHRTAVPTSPTSDAPAREGLRGKARIRENRVNQNRENGRDIAGVGGEPRHGGDALPHAVPRGAGGGDQRPRGVGVGAAFTASRGTGKRDTGHGPARRE